MKTQAQRMRESEADAWLDRNRSGMGRRDPVSDIIAELGIEPKFVMEVGCSNGWRLAKLRDKYNCIILGVEPGQQACIEAAKRCVPAFLATASELPAKDNAFDVLIYGFSLYMADPADWFKIAFHGDRVLKAGGYLIVHDFAETQPFARRYEHCDEMLAYHVDFAKFWLGNPLYSLEHRRIFANDEMVSVLRKNPPESIEVLS